MGVFGENKETVYDESCILCSTRFVFIFCFTKTWINRKHDDQWKKIFKYEVKGNVVVMKPRSDNFYNDSSQNFLTLIVLQLCLTLVIYVNTKSSKLKMC